MTASRILTGILGVLMIIAGFFCMLWPGMTYVASVWMIGIAIIVGGIANIISWSDRKKLGVADGWSLAGAIVSILFGIVLLVSFAMQVLMDVFVAYFVAAWLLVYGIIRIVMAFKLRKVRDEVGEGSLTSRWGWVLAMGILMVICGIIGFFNPISLMLALGFLVGIAIIVYGFDMITMAIVA